LRSSAAAKPASGPASDALALRKAPRRAAMDWAATRGLLKRAMPVCFAVGAAMELFMIKVPVGGHTFYDVAKRKKAERLLEEMEERQRVEDERLERKARLRAKYDSLLEERGNQRCSD